MALRAFSGCLILALWLIGESAAGRQDVSKSAAPNEARRLKSPVPFTRASVAQGKQIYLRNCVECHDFDGRSLSGRDFAAAPPVDLTYPEGWLHGTTEGEIFTSIREGTAEEMPPYKGKLKDEQIWHLVNFVRTLWPEASRPKFPDKP